MPCFAAFLVCILAVWVVVRLGARLDGGALDLGQGVLCAPWAGRTINCRLGGRVAGTTLAG